MNFSEFTQDVKVCGLLEEYLMLFSCDVMKESRYFRVLLLFAALKFIKNIRARAGAEAGQVMGNFCRSSPTSALSRHNCTSMDIGRQTLAADGLFLHLEHPPEVQS